MKFLAILFGAAMLMFSVVLGGIVVLGVLVGQSSSASSGVVSGDIGTVIAFLYAQIGKPYVANTQGPDTYDCSGLVTAAYRTVGIELPPLTFTQVTMGAPVPVDPSLVRPGDAVFMRGGRPVTDLGHVGVAVSSTEMISAPSPGETVHVSPIPWHGIQQVRRYIMTVTPTMDGSWEDFLAAHYETSGHINPDDHLDGPQVAEVFYWAGGCRGQKLVDIVAIAGRESGWGTTAYNFHAETTGDISLGLVQENVKGDMMGRLAQAGLSDPRQLFDPINAGHAMYVLSSGCTDLSPWGGYKGWSDTYNTDGMAALAAVAAARNQGLIGD